MGGGSCPRAETPPSPQPPDSRFTWEVPSPGRSLPQDQESPPQSPDSWKAPLQGCPRPRSEPPPQPPAPDSRGRCPRGGVPVPGPGCSGWVSWRGCRARGRGWGCWAVTTLVAPPVAAAGCRHREVSSVPPVNPLRTPCTPRAPRAPHPPAAVDEEGLGALDLGRPLAPVPLTGTSILLGGLPETALLSPPLHGIICGERGGLAPWGGPRSFGGAMARCGQPPQDTTPGSMWAPTPGTHPGVFSWCPDQQDPSPGHSAEPRVAAEGWGVPVPPVLSGYWGLECNTDGEHSRLRDPQESPTPHVEPSPAAPHQHGGSGGTGRCWLSRAGLSRAGLSFARPSFAGPSRAGAVGSRKPSVAAAAQPKHLLGSGQTSSGGRSQLHLTALASGPGRPRREPGAREPPWEPPPAPPLAQPPRVPTHGRCQRPRGATVLGHRPRSDTGHAPVPAPN